MKTKNEIYIFYSWRTRIPASRYSYKCVYVVATSQCEVTQLTRVPTQETNWRKKIFLWIVINFWERYIFQWYELSSYVNRRQRGDIGDISWLITIFPKLSGVEIWRGYSLNDWDRILRLCSVDGKTWAKSG